MADVGALCLSSVSARFPREDKHKAPTHPLHRPLSLRQVWRLHGIVGHGGPGSSGVGSYFFDWLTDPEKNGAGALTDLGCYNALWSLWFRADTDANNQELQRLIRLRDQEQAVAGLSMLIKRAPFSYS